MSELTKRDMVVMNQNEMSKCADFFMVVSEKTKQLLEYVQTYDKDHFEEARFYIETGLENTLGISDSILRGIEHAEEIKGVQK